MIHHRSQTARSRAFSGRVPHALDLSRSQGENHAWMKFTLRQCSRRLTMTDAEIAGPPVSAFFDHTSRGHGLRFFETLEIERQQGIQLLRVTNRGRGRYILRSPLGTPQSRHDTSSSNTASSRTSTSARSCPSAAHRAEGAMGQVLSLEVKDFECASDPRMGRLEALTFEDVDLSKENPSGSIGSTRPTTSTILDGDLGFPPRAPASCFLSCLTDRLIQIVTGVPSNFVGEKLPPSL